MNREKIYDAREFENVNGNEFVVITDDRKIFDSLTA